MRRSIAIVNNAAASNWNGQSDVANDFIVGDEIVFNNDIRLPKRLLKEAEVVQIAPVTASGLSDNLTFAGSFVAGDTIKVTVSSNLTNQQKFRKTYRIDVVAGDTVTTIAKKLVAKIQFDVDNALNSPFASVSNVAGPGVVTITQLGDDSRGMVITYYTDSAAGTIEGAISGEIASTAVVSEGQPADLEEAGIPSGDITLSTYDTVKIKAAFPSAEPYIDSQGATIQELVVYVDSTDATGFVIAGGAGAATSIGEVLEATINAL